MWCNTWGRGLEGKGGQHMDKIRSRYLGWCLNRPVLVGENQVTGCGLLDARGLLWRRVVKLRAFYSGTQVASGGPNRQLL